MFYTGYCKTITVKKRKKSTKSQGVKTKARLFQGQDHSLFVLNLSSRSWTVL